jgi:hypothetical protein
MSPVVSSNCVCSIFFPTASIVMNVDYVVEQAKEFALTRKAAHVWGNEGELVAAFKEAFGAQDAAEWLDARGQRRRRLHVHTRPWVHAAVK